MFVVGVRGVRNDLCMLSVQMLKSRTGNCRTPLQRRAGYMMFHSNHILRTRKDIVALHEGTNARKIMSTHTVNGNPAKQGEEGRETMRKGHCLKIDPSGAGFFLEVNDYISLKGNGPRRGTPCP